VQNGRVNTILSMQVSPPIAHTPGFIYIIPLVSLPASVPTAYPSSGDALPLIDLYNAPVIVSSSLPPAQTLFVA